MPYTLTENSAIKDIFLVQFTFHFAIFLQYGAHIIINITIIYYYIIIPSTRQKFHIFYYFWYKLLFILFWESVL